MQDGRHYGAGYALDRYPTWDRYPSASTFQKGKSEKTLACLGRQDETAVGLQEIKYKVVPRNHAGQSHKWDPWQDLVPQCAT
jgi:hypothetical protein